MDVSVIVPMFNEEESVETTLSAIDDVLESSGRTYEILAVDDGSRDATAALLKKARAKNKHVRVVTHAVNKGLGSALKTGFANAKGDYVVTIDADLSYNPQQIPKMLGLLEQGADIVLASPYMQGGTVAGVKPYRLLLSKLGNAALRHSMRLPFRTVTSMYRAYRRKALESMNIESTGPEVNPEVIVKAAALGCRIVEIPSVLKGRTAGRSKFKLLSSFGKHLRLFLLCHRWRITPPSAGKYSMGGLPPKAAQKIRPKKN
jgi:dolichol-phosphate mannosyltransferase